MSKFILFLLIFQHLINAAYPSVDPAVRHLGMEDGMANNLVRSVYQDKKGFFWFGTKDGLNRYDGYGFKVFRNQVNDRHSLINNIVHTICSDQAYNLWIGTRQGISVYNDLTGQFKAAVYKDFYTGKLLNIRKVIREIVSGPGNTMLIGTEGSGLLRSKPGTTITCQIPLRIGNTQTVSYGVQSVKVASDGKVWVFVQNLGLCYLDEKKQQLVLANNQILMTFVMEVVNGVVYLGTINGLYSYDINSKKMDSSPIQISKSGTVSLSSIAVDESGVLWLGTTDRGLFLYNPLTKQVEMFRAKDKDSGLNGELIYSIFIDSESRKWVGTSYGGVTVIDPSKKTFASWSHQPGKNSLPSNAMSAFFQAPSGEIYIGTEGAGFSIWNRKTNHFSNYRKTTDLSSLSSDFVTSIAMGKGNRIWLGTFTEGPNRFDPVSKKIRRYRLVFPKTGIESKVAYTVFADADSTVWAGTLRRGSLMGGLFKYNNNNDRFELFDSNLSDLFTIIQLKDKSLWGGDLNQLVKIDKQKKKHKYYGIGHTVRSIYEAANSLLYIGTEGGGLFAFDQKKEKIVARYTTGEGLCNNSVLTIIGDASGNLWMSTYYGVSAFNLKTQSFRNFYQSDGLQSNQFQTNSGLKLKTGEIIFGGIKGFSLFDPDHIVIPDRQPKLLLTGIEINNKPLESQSGLITEIDLKGVKGIEVPYTDAIFSFNFTAFEYSSPEKITYQYKMDGWDRGWSTSGKDRKATYTHISEGSYVFRVKCTSAAGIWGGEEVTLAITILPPWYRTWWAYLGYSAVISFLLFAYMRYQNNQTKLKYEVKVVNLEVQRKKAEYESEMAKHQLERIAHEKERLINEQEKALAEKQMSFFTNISHEFRSPLSLILNPVDDLLKKAEANGEAVEDLSIIQRNAKRMLSLVDQLLLFKKADAGFDKLQLSKIDLNKLIHEVYLCFSQQAASDGIQYKYHCTAENAVIYADVVKMEIVIFNLISNAIKYTPKRGTIGILLEETEDELRLSVADSGPGIPAAAGNLIFERFFQAERKHGMHKSGFGIGLYLAKLFVDAHNGVIVFENKPEGGSLFSITLPKGQDYCKEVPNSRLINEGSAHLSSALENDDHQPAQEIVDVEIWPLSDRKSILVVDDDEELRKYISGLFSATYQVYQAEDGEEGLKIAIDKIPDLIITDYRMKEIDGIQLCRAIKSNPNLSPIPVILLTASASSDVKLQSINGGADDHINKPFEREYLIARVANLLKNRNHLQNYFYNEITLQSNNVIVSEEYKMFLENCIQVVEKYLNDTDFGIKVLAGEVGMSHSTLYKRVKSISGQSVTAFIRCIKLRKAAEMMINSDFNVTEVALSCGFNDAKYFGKQFSKLFKLNPSEFIKRHRKSFNKQYRKK